MPKHSLTLSCQSIAVAEKAEDLEPNANEAAKDEEAAAKEHFEEDDVRPSALTIKSYNCTEIVPTLPARCIDNHPNDAWISFVLGWLFMQTRVVFGGRLGT